MLGDLAKVEALVREGADVNNVTKEHGWSLLYEAATNGRLAVVQYLAQQGADKNKAANDGYTPLCGAACGGHLAVVQYLVQQGVDKDKLPTMAPLPSLLLS